MDDPEFDPMNSPDLQTSHQEPAEALRDALAREVERRTRGIEQCATAVPNLTLYRREAPSPPSNCMLEPSIALIVQGAKRAHLGDEAYDYDFRRFLVTSLDIPVMMQVVEASAARPYLGLTLKLDAGLLAGLMAQCRVPPASPPSRRGLLLGQTTPVLLDAFRRLLALLDETDAIAVVAPLVQEEIHYRLLMSDQGARLWQIASVGSQSHRIARAVDWLKTHYAEPLRIEALASHVQMSPSSFHHHFRLLTAMSPLRFQKWLRLNEARRLMLFERLDAASAAFRVGYESPSQFSREYARLFGAPPRRDIEELRRVSGDA
jgi:AraC-like DNA-binding protein